jgi:UDP-2-acetamido-3-amino-2,3-dideoxy-glucuronate N-acetyltransferase
MSGEETGRVVHETAVVEDGADIGDGCRIWHFAHVRAGASIGPGTVIGKSVYVDGGAVIGDNCKVQNFVSVYTGVTLADEVFVGPSAVFTNDLVPRAASADWKLVRTRVERGASIGANATILCGVTIGEWAMVGAGSVVTGDVAAHHVVVGNPAHAIGWVCRCGHRVDGPGSTCDACGMLLQID